MSKGCPFYGASLVFTDIPEILPMFSSSPHLLIQPGNRCALITSGHSPCYLEVHGRDPAWDGCWRNPEINGSYELPHARPPLQDADIDEDCR